MRKGASVMQPIIPIPSLSKAQSLNCSAYSRSDELKWKRLITSLTLWVLGEILLGAVGLDELADYGEFLSERHEIALLAEVY